jgi:hypothetical protein
MKKLILVAAVLALVWFAWTRFGASVPPKAEVALVPATPPKPVPAVEAPRPAESAPVSSPVVYAEPAVAAPKPASGPVTPYPQMSLAEMLQPNNRFHDPLFGVSVTLPEGWSVRQAMRWGENNRENTVFLKPPEGEAIPSMYYQHYPDGAPELGQAEARLREMAQKKEESRSMGGTNDYKNDPDSFVFRQIDGHPSLSYFATYTQNEQVRAEYFMRILGEKGYVMFFVRGPVKDVQAVIPVVHQMGGTVKPP